MERGFITPDGGYFQVIDAGEKRDENGEIVRPEITAADYQTGTIEVPVRPSSRNAWDGENWVEVIPTQAEIDAAIAGEVEAELTSTDAQEALVAAVLDIAVAVDPAFGPQKLRQKMRDHIKAKRGQA